YLGHQRQLAALRGRVHRDHAVVRAEAIRALDIDRAGTGRRRVDELHRRNDMWREAVRDDEAVGSVRTAAVIDQHRSWTNLRGDLGCRKWRRGIAPRCLGVRTL